MSFNNIGNRNQQQSQQRPNQELRNNNRNNNDNNSFNSSDSIINDITKSIFNFSNRVVKLQQYVSQLGSDKDTQQLRENIHNEQNECKNLARDTGNLIKSITTHINTKKREGKLSPQQEHKLTLQQKKLSKDFASQLHRFEEVQKLSMRKEKTSVARARRSISMSMGMPHENENSSLVENEHQTQQQQQQQLQAQAIDHDVQYNEALIQEREEGIREIESTIIEVNDIFKDLGNLIHDQRSIVENIESNIYSVSSNVEAGHEQITQAQTYQKKSRNKMCFILFILIAILAILFLFLIYFKN